MQRHPVTPAGYEFLVSELRRHKEFVRPGIVRDIEEARAHGDISENSEYEDAKERQSLCEARINDLENRVSLAEIIDVAKLTPSDRVVFGTTVVIADVNGNERTWTIVGESEADIDNGRISFMSPLGKSLIGRHEGDDVEVPAPAGRQRWEILEVRYK